MNPSPRRRRINAAKKTKAHPGSKTDDVIMAIVREYLAVADSGGGEFSLDCFTKRQIKHLRRMAKRKGKWWTDYLREVVNGLTESIRKACAEMKAEEVAARKEVAA